MGAKLTPSVFDCDANALPDEPKFTFLARDPQAPNLIRQWASKRSIAITIGHRPLSDMAQVSEAHACADAMEAWRKAANYKWRK